MTRKSCYNQTDAFVLMLTLARRDTSVLLRLLQSPASYVTSPPVLIFV